MPAWQFSERLHPAVREPGQRILVTADHAEPQSERQQGAGQGIGTLLVRHLAQAVLESAYAASQLAADRQVNKRGRDIANDHAPQNHHAKLADPDAIGRHRELLTGNGHVRKLARTRALGQR